MGQFMVGDRVKLKRWLSDKKPTHLLTGVVVAVFPSGWCTIKHDDVGFAAWRRSKHYESWVGPRYDWRVEELVHLCDLLRLVAAIDDKPALLSA